MALDITKLFDRKVEITSDGILIILLSKVKLIQYKKIKDDIAMKMFEIPEVIEQMKFDDEKEINVGNVASKLLQDTETVKKMLAEKQGDYLSLIEGGENAVKKHYEEVIKQNHEEISYEDYTMLLNAEIINEMEQELKKTPTNS